MAIQFCRQAKHNAAGVVTAMQNIFRQPENLRLTAFVFNVLLVIVLLQASLTKDACRENFFTFCCIYVRDDRQIVFVFHLTEKRFFVNPTFG